MGALKSPTGGNSVRFLPRTLRVFAQTSSHSKLPSSLTAVWPSPNLGKGLETRQNEVQTQRQVGRFPSQPVPPWLRHLSLWVSISLTCEWAAAHLPRCFVIPIHVMCPVPRWPTAALNKHKEGCSKVVWIPRPLPGLGRI